VFAEVTMECSDVAALVKSIGYTVTVLGETEMGLRSRIDSEVAPMSDMAEGRRAGASSRNDFANSPDLE
jgi:hypothetical protein